MEIDFYTLIAILLTTALLCVAIWFRPTRMIVAAIMAIAAVVMIPTGWMTFLAIPLLLIALLLFYSEYADRRRARHATRQPH